MKSHPHSWQKRMLGTSALLQCKMVEGMVLPYMFGQHMMHEMGNGLRHFHVMLWSKPQPASSVVEPALHDVGHQSPCQENSHHLKQGYAEKDSSHDVDVPRQPLLQS